MALHQGNEMKQFRTGQLMCSKTGQVYLLPTPEMHPNVSNK